MPEKTISAPTRRSVAKGIAWSAPVIAAASLAPFVAASPTQCIGVLPTSQPASASCNNLSVKPAISIAIVDANIVVSGNLRLQIPAGVSLGVDESITLRVRLGGLSTDVGVSVSPATIGVLTVGAVTSKVTTLYNTYDVVITLTNKGTAPITGDIEVPFQISIPLTSLLSAELLSTTLTIELLGIKWGSRAECTIDTALGTLISVPLSLSISALGALTYRILDGVTATGLTLCVLGGVIGLYLI